MAKDKPRDREPEREEGARSFARMIEQIDDGHGVIEMSQELVELMKNLHKHAQHTQSDAKGVLTLKLGFSVAANGVTSIAYEMSTKTPKRRTGKTTLWVTSGGNLSVSNPRQQTLPLREVERPRNYNEVDNDVEPVPAREV
jgi:hypothetical protein